MLKFIRQSFWGRVLYRVSGRKLFTYPEEAKDYVIPEKYLVASPTETSSDVFSEKVSDKELATQEVNNSSGDNVSQEPENASQELKVVSSEHKDESDKESKGGEGEEITPAAEGKIFVEWDGPDDPENPYNWPLSHKIFLIFQICFLTTSVYIGAAIYTPGIEDIMIDLKVNQTLATLPLTMFVIGYGVGPMIFSPMSENAYFGRTNIYIFTLFIFFILQIPTALVKNIAGLSILRLISGFFASPALATGGASILDVITIPYAPMGIATWAIAAVCGPSLGPLVGSVLTVKGGWRWTFWFMAIISGTCLLVLSFLLPETYGKTLLLRKAGRLRRLTNNPNITTQEEIDNSNLNFQELAIETLWKPIEISLIEPVVLLINLYIALVYSILYLWFEAFPVVFIGVYDFTLIEMGVSFTGVVVGIWIACGVYIYWVYHAFTKKLLAGQPITPELFIPVAILGGTIMAIGIFIFGWTAAKDLHWIGPIIGAGIFAAGAFLIFQTLFNYLSMSFWKHLASVFAGNDLFRSWIAGVFPLFGRALYTNLKTSRFIAGWGSTILGIISAFMVLIPILFYKNGPKLRARSKFSSL